MADESGYKSELATRVKHLESQMQDLAKRISEIEGSRSVTKLQSKPIVMDVQAGPSLN